MARAQDLVANGLEGLQKLLNRFVEDLTPAEYLHRPVAGANCAAWILGHLVLSERRWLTAVGVKDLPALPDGFDQRFARTPEASKAAQFGDVTMLRPLFNEHRRRTIEAVRGLSDSQMDEPAGMTNPMFRTIGEAAAFIAIHAGMHSGQISTIRRSLGRPPMM